MQLRHHLRFIGSIVCLLLSMHTTPAQTSWYVSPAGINGAGRGLSPATPFATITYAASSLNPGDTLFVMGGTYTNAGYQNGDHWKQVQTARINNRNGNAAQWITIKPYQNQHPIFKGDGNIIFQLRQCSYIRVQGLEIYGEVENIPLDTALAYQFAYRQNGSTVTEYRVPPGTPVSVIETMTFPTLSNIIRPSTFNTMGMLVQTCHHVVVENCLIHHLPGTGLRGFECDYLTFSENEIHNNSRRSSVGNHGLVLHTSTSIDQSDDPKIFIERNFVHHNYNEVYSWSELKTFITPHIDEGKGISLQKNFFTNGWTYGRILVRNNLASYNGFSGVHANEAVRIDFVNNTAYLNSLTGTGNNIGISYADADSVTMHNNVVVAATGWGGFALSIANTTHIAASGNLVQGIMDPDLGGIVTDHLTGDPLFVNAAGDDFHLTALSPAVNTAVAAYAPTHDYETVLRDAQPDRGAYEFEAPMAWDPEYTRKPGMGQAPSLLVWPNPCTSTLLITGAASTLPARITDITGHDLSGSLRWLYDGDRLTGVELTNLPAGLYLFTQGPHTLRILHP